MQRSATIGLALQPLIVLRAFGTSRRHVSVSSQHQINECAELLFTERRQPCSLKVLVGEFRQVEAAAAGRDAPDKVLSR